MGKWLMERWFWVVVLLGMLGVPRPGYACSPPTGDRWFTEHFELDVPDLPAGVNIHLAPTEKLHNPNRQEIVFRNDSASSLNILTHQASSADRYLEQPDFELPDGWFAGPYILPNRNRVNTALQLMSFAPDFEDYNFDEYDYPDEPLQLPPAQESYFLLAFEDQIYRISFSMYYTINEAFEPTEVAGGPCGVGEGTALVLLIIAGILNLFQQPGYLIIGLFILVSLVLFTKAAKKYVV